MARAAGLEATYRPRTEYSTLFLPSSSSTMLDGYHTAGGCRKYQSRIEKREGGDSILYGDIIATLQWHGIIMYDDRCVAKRSLQIELLNVNSRS